MIDLRLNVLIMSGVEDGTSLEYSTRGGDGKVDDEKWTVSIGRKEENDICLRNDTYVSRQHANIHWRSTKWWLEDCDSRNGTFINNEDDFFDDQPVKGFIHLQEGQLFRVGRTWLRIQLDG